MFPNRSLLLLLLVLFYMQDMGSNACLKILEQHSEDVQHAIQTEFTLPGGFGSVSALGTDSRVQHCQSRAETVMIWPPVYTNQDAFVTRNNTGDRTNDWGNNAVTVKSN